MITKSLRKLNHSWIWDVIGVTAILAAVYVSGYYKTPLSRIWFLPKNSFTALPLLGVLSTISAILSITSTRLTARLNNMGNVVGWISATLAGFINFALGNAGAVLTYPFSVYLNWKASHAWKTRKVEAQGLGKIISIMVMATLLSIVLNLIGFWMMHQQLNAIFVYATIIFALSLVANVLNTMKSEQQWWFWAIYNVVQLLQSFAMFNIANVAKYLFYIANSIIAGIDWLAEKGE